jgi:hypothetical protein
LIQGSQNDHEPFRIERLTSHNTMQAASNVQTVQRMAPLTANFRGHPVVSFVLEMATIVSNGETGKTQKVNTLNTARNFPTIPVTVVCALVFIAVLPCSEGLNNES